MRERIHVIHNWAPLEDMPLRPRENAWSRQQNLGEGARFIYSGTLAMKHNPALLLELARMLDRDSSGELLVVSEGAGVEWLAEQAAGEGLRSLRCLGFQPFEVLPDVLGSADVLVAILEPDAGVFSVPSKVLSYFCAGRPVLLAVPRENLAAKIVVESGAGLVVEPSDLAGFCAAAQQLIDSPELRATLRPGRPSTTPKRISISAALATTSRRYSKQKMLYRLRVVKWIERFGFN